MLIVGRRLIICRKVNGLTCHFFCSCRLRRFSFDDWSDWSRAGLVNHPDEQSRWVLAHRDSWAFGGRCDDGTGRYRAAEFGDATGPGHGNERGYGDRQQGRMREHLHAKRQPLHQNGTTVYLPLPVMTLEAAPR